MSGKNSDLPTGVRHKPAPGVSTAKPAATNPDFRSVDKQLGGLVVNRWTYRPLRFLTKRLLPKLDSRGLSVEEREVTGRSMQIVRPESATGEGAVLFLHGGGYVIGSNLEARIHAALFARRAGVPVFCPSYRLAPDHPFPAGLDDVYGAWQGLVSNAASLAIDPEKIVIGGISAGGGLAAALAQRLLDEGGAQPSGQLLFCPMLDDRTAARTDFGLKAHRVWSNRNNVFGWTSYLGVPPGGEAPKYAAAARRDDVAGLPPAWIGVGNADLFLDEDRAYAQRLTDAGNDVTYIEVDGGIHAFDIAENSPLTKAFHASAVAFVKRFAA